jgi:hypothetical protein
MATISASISTYALQRWCGTSNPANATVNHMWRTCFEMRIGLLAPAPQRKVAFVKRTCTLELQYGWYHTIHARGEQG